MIVLAVEKVVMIEIHDIKLILHCNISIAIWTLFVILSLTGIAGFPL
jgi:hypothetical protein